VTGAKRWLILRTSGRSTLPLAASLAEDGFEVWTPAKSVTIRRARWNVRRDVTVPLMAEFVFAREDYLLDLVNMAEMPERPRRGSHPAHAKFSVFYHFDRIPLVEDAALDPLREAEQDAGTLADLNYFQRGDKVLVPQGIFGGMSGIVERSDGTHTLVRFGSKLRVKISTFILKPNGACVADNAVKQAA